MAVTGSRCLRLCEKKKKKKNSHSSPLFFLNNSLRAKRRRGNGPANLLNPSYRGEDPAKR